MAIVNFVNYSSHSKSSQSRGCMRSVMKYVSRDDKTLWHDHQLVTGVNCQAASAYDDFLNTKLLYHKDSGRMFYHLVQSFPSGAEVDPGKAHAAALKLAEQFKDHEVLVCTHTDCDHVHSHLIINSVNFETGRKLHVDGNVIQELKTVNDQICSDLSLPVFEPQQERRESPMSSREYRSAEKGQSWKLRLMATIDECMAYAGNKDEFIDLMRSEGYEVKWTDERKYITYTTPDDQRCRDNKLHETKYLKENMEHEFTIREAQILRGAEGPEQAGPDHGGADGDVRHADGAKLESGDLAPQWSTPAPGTDGGVAHHADYRRGRGERPASDSRASDRPTGGPEPASQDLYHTGWESERELLYQRRYGDLGLGESDQQRGAYRQDMDHPDSNSLIGLDYLAGTVAAVAVTTATLEDTGPVRDATTTHYHVDTKALKETRRKKIAMGYKADDHEDEEPTWSQKMF